MQLGILSNGLKLTMNLVAFIFVAALVLLSTMVPALASTTAKVSENSVLAPRQSPTDIPSSRLALAQTFLSPTKGWAINATGLVEFDANLWDVEKLEDGSEIYTGKSSAKNNGVKVAMKPEIQPIQKRVVLRDGPTVSSISTFILTPAKSTGVSTQLHEQSASVIFLKGDLFGVTQCNDKGDKGGRDCLTVTKKTCDFIKNPATVLPETLSKELKTIEVRALSTILTLRGADHQLENLARLGNRMGLKNPEQTTKGKLTAKHKAHRHQTLSKVAALCKSAQL